MWVNFVTGSSGLLIGIISAMVWRRRGTEVPPDIEALDPEIIRGIRRQAKTAAEAAGRPLAAQPIASAIEDWLMLQRTIANRPAPHVLQHRRSSRWRRR